MYGFFIFTYSKHVDRFHLALFKLTLTALLIHHKQ